MRDVGVASPTKSSDSRVCAVKRPADKVGTQARLHADDAGRQLSEGIGKRQPLQLPAKRDLPVTAISDDVEDLLANINSNRCQCRVLRVASSFVRYDVFLTISEIGR
jgi:hypothetical protein